MSVPAATTNRSFTRANVRVKFEATRISPLGTEWSDAVGVAHEGPAQADLLHGAADPRDGHDVADAEGVLAEDEDAVEVVADQLLSAEAECAADGRSEGHAERAQGRDHLRDEDGDRGDADQDDEGHPAQALREEDQGIQAAAAGRLANGLLVRLEVSLAGSRRLGGAPGQAANDRHQERVDDEEDDHDDRQRTRRPSRSGRSRRGDRGGLHGSSLAPGWSAGAARAAAAGSGSRTAEAHRDRGRRFAGEGHDLRRARRRDPERGAPDGERGDHPGPGIDDGDGDPVRALDPLGERGGVAAPADAGQLFQQGLETA